MERNLHLQNGKKFAPSKWKEICTFVFTIQLIGKAPRWMERILHLQKWKEICTFVNINVNVNLKKTWLKLVYLVTYHLCWLELFFTLLCINEGSWTKRKSLSQPKMSQSSSFRHLRIVAMCQIPSLVSRHWFKVHWGYIWQASGRSWTQENYQLSLTLSQFCVFWPKWFSVTT